MKLLTADECIEIKDKAYASMDTAEDSLWKKAHEELAFAADRVHAMMRRSEVAQSKSDVGLTRLAEFITTKFPNEIGEGSVVDVTIGILEKRLQDERKDASA